MRQNGLQGCGRFFIFAAKRKRYGQKQTEPPAVLQEGG